MATFTHILVPTDFGEASGRALDLALTLAENFGSKLTIFHAYALEGFGYADGIALPSLIEELTRGAQSKLDDAVRDAKQRYAKAEGLLAWGVPWSEILEAARTCGADLIVMGTHGRRGISRVFLGSVAEKIVRLSPAPVLSVSSKQNQVSKEALPLQTPNG